MQTQHELIEVNGPIDHGQSDGAKKPPLEAFHSQLGVGARKQGQLHHVLLSHTIMHMQNNICWVFLEVDELWADATISRPS